MRSRIIVGLAVAGLVFAAADCKKKPEPAKGWIEVKGADFNGHEIVDAATGAVIGNSSSTQSVVAVPAGTYDVMFGKTAVKGVVVRAGETTVLAPGGLGMKHASYRGHDVVAADTGAVQGKLSSMASSVTLAPGRYNVMFGPLAWPVEVEAGKTLELDPGILELVGAGVQGHKIHAASGEVVGEVSNTGSSIPLPAGAYTIEIDGQNVPFAIELGQRTTLKR